MFAQLAEEKRRNAMILEDMRQTHRIAMTAVKAQAAQIRHTLRIAFLMYMETEYAWLLVC